MGGGCGSSPDRRARGLGLSAHDAVPDSWAIPNWLFILSMVDFSFYSCLLLVSGVIRCRLMRKESSASDAKKQGRCAPGEQNVSGCWCLAYSIAFKSNSFHRRPCNSGLHSVTVPEADKPGPSPKMRHPSVASPVVFPPVQLKTQQSDEP